MTESTYAVKDPESINIMVTPKTNTDIWLGDDLVLKTYREKPFTWIQRKLISWCFGWRVKPIEEEE